MWKIESRSLRSGELNEGTVDLIMERATESIFSHGTLSVPLLCSKKRRKHTDSVRERKWTYRVSIKFNRFNRPQKLETRNFTFLLSHRFLASYLKKNSLNSSCFSTVSRKKRWFYKFLRGNVCTSDNRPRLIAIFSFLLFFFFISSSHMFALSRLVAYHLRLFDKQASITFYQPFLMLRHKAVRKR